MKATRVVLIIFGALALILLIPRRVIVAPEWTITLVDELGRPMQGISMQEVWQHYSLENVPGREVKTTDAAGRVVFPARLRTASRTRRFVGCTQQVRRYAYEASCGPHSWVVITYPAGFGQNNDEEYRQADLRFDGGPYRRTDRVVLHRCKSGGSGITCSVTR